MVVRFCGGLGCFCLRDSELFQGFLVFGSGDCSPSHLGADLKDGTSFSDSFFYLLSSFCGGEGCVGVVEDVPYVFEIVNFVIGHDILGVCPYGLDLVGMILMRVEPGRHVGLSWCRGPLECLLVCESCVWRLLAHRVCSCGVCSVELLFEKSRGEGGVCVLF